MMHQRARQSAASEIAAAKNAVRGAIARRNVKGKRSNHNHVVSEVITRVLSFLKDDDIVSFSEWIDKFPAQVTRIRPPLKIANYGDLWPKYHLPPTITSLGTTLTWTTTYLVDKAVQINLYIEFLSALETHWFLGEYEAALSVLDKIDAVMGVSIWAMETRISLLQRCRGLEAQKEYAQSIHEQFPNGVPAFIAHYISERNEDGISFDRFCKKIGSLLSRKSNSNIIKYFRKELIGSKGVYLDEADIAEILSVSASLSVIDAYEGFLWASQSAIERGLTSRIGPAMGGALGRLSVRDWRLGKLRAYFYRDFTGLEIRDPSPEDSLLRGDYASSLAKALGATREDPSDIDSLVTAAISRAMSSLHIETEPLLPLQSELMPMLISIRKKTGLVARTASDLLKTVLNIQALRVARAVYGYVVAEWSERPQVGECEASAIFLCTRTLNPLHWLALPRDVAHHLLSYTADKLSTQLVHIVSSGLLSGTNDRLDVLSSELRMEFDALASLHRGQVPEALEAARRLSKSGTDLASRLAAKIELHCLLQQGETGEAICRTANYCSQQDDFRHILPLRALLTGERWRNVRHLRAEISLPIIFDLYCRTIDESEHETNRRIAYDEFLNAHNCKRPSDLQRYVSQFPFSQLIYFLYRLCVRNVMDVSFKVYGSSRELEEERIRICSWLAELDPQYSSTYGDEVKDITKLIEIQDGLRDVDASRVYVNTEGIVRWTEKEVQEAFYRYKNLLRSGIGFGSPEEFERAMRQMVEDADQTAAEPFMQYPTNEGDHLLIEIFEAIKGEYLLHPDYGLDVYLSMRIRHGSLSGHLRGPLEERSLIVPMDEAEKEYCDNKAWIMALVLTIPMSVNV